MPLQNELCFVQFIHPGKEHRPNWGRSIRWNTANHKRKFVEINGRCIRDGKQDEGPLRFWTEWEPESEVTAEIPEPIPDGPQFVYRPYYVIPNSYTGLQNTDPYVFGSFFYTLCQQNTKRGPTQLRYLSRGSVILFGSCVSDSFAIDTVFVVDKWQDHNEQNVSKLRPEVPDAYWDVTLAAWYQRENVLLSCSPSKSSTSWRLYFGATSDDPVHGMFSFFPCAPAAKVPNGFARPTITIPNLITESLLQGKRLNRGLALDAVKRHWDDVCNQVTQNGLYLGNYAETPELRLRPTA